MTGASAALGTTPGMLGYGLSKSATHFLVQSLAAEPLFRKATIAAILPTTIDTPANRAAMPDAKYEDWTKVRAPRILLTVYICVSPLTKSGMQYAHCFEPLVCAGPSCEAK
jgi:NAD(P)-dependent dehydrogenase (short-subunit alcohol dehydrogenase family)